MYSVPLERSANQVQQVAEVDVPDEDRMGPSHVRVGDIAEEHVVAQSASPSVSTRKVYRIRPASKTSFFPSGPSTTTGRPVSMAVNR